jgi:hypothetical protein
VGGRRGREEGGGGEKKEGEGKEEREREGKKRREEREGGVGWHYARSPKQQLFRSICCSGAVFI